MRILILFSIANQPERGIYAASPLKSRQANRFINLVRALKRHKCRAPRTVSRCAHPDVTQELEAAALWYEERQADFGEYFLKEYQVALGRIVNAPERWRKIRGENRKLNFHHFPYAIIFSLEKDAIYIKAVMHLHRRPFYSLNRNPQS